MSRRFHKLLLSGCLVIGVLQAPDAFRSLEEGWHGAYASEPTGRLPLETASGAHSIQADAKAELAAQKSESFEEISAPVLRAGI